MRNFLKLISAEPAGKEIRLLAPGRNLAKNTRELSCLLNTSYRLSS